MAPAARSQEFLYDHDKGLARVRRMLRQMAEAQIKELEAFRQQAKPETSPTALAGE